MIDRELQIGDVFYHANSFNGTSNVKKVFEGVEWKRTDLVKYTDLFKFEVVGKAYLTFEGEVTDYIRNDGHNEYPRLFVKLVIIYEQSPRNCYTPGEIIEWYRNGHDDFLTLDEAKAYLDAKD